MVRGKKCILVREKPLIGEISAKPRSLNQWVAKVAIYNGGNFFSVCSKCHYYWLVQSLHLQLGLEGSAMDTHKPCWFPKIRDQGSPVNPRNEPPHWDELAKYLWPDISVLYLPGTLQRKGSLSKTVRDRNSCLERVVFWWSRRYCNKVFSGKIWKSSVHVLIWKEGKHTVFYLWGLQITIWGK
jgi:hypothetical protein